MELAFVPVSFLEVPAGSLSEILIIGLGINTHNSLNDDWNMVTVSQLVYESDVHPLWPWQGQEGMSSSGLCSGRMACHLID